MRDVCCARALKQPLHSTRLNQGAKSISADTISLQSMAGSTMGLPGDSTGKEI